MCREVNMQNSNVLVYGKIPVKNALLSDSKVKTLYLKREDISKDIQSLASKKGIAYKIVSENEMNKIAGGVNHQGVVAILESFPYHTFDYIRSLDKDPSLIIMLDGINDPVNLGSMIRTSCAFNLDAMIISKNHQVLVTPTVSKVSTGADLFLPIVKVTNLNTTIRELKKLGYWIISTSDHGATDYNKIDYPSKICLVIGSEGDGVSRLVLESSDFVAKIPLDGPIRALNASIACSILIAKIKSLYK